MRIREHEIHFLERLITEALVSENSSYGDSGVQGPAPAVPVMVSVPTGGRHVGGCFWDMLQFDVVSVLSMCPPS